MQHFFPFWLLKYIKRAQLTINTCRLGGYPLLPPLLAGSRRVWEYPLLAQRPSARGEGVAKPTRHLGAKGTHEQGIKRGGRTRPFAFALGIRNPPKESRAEGEGGVRRPPFNYWGHACCTVTVHPLLFSLLILFHRYGLGYPMRLEPV